MKLGVKEGEGKVVEFGIGFRENGVRKEYYGLKVEGKEVLWKDGKYWEERSRVGLKLEEEGVVNRCWGLEDMVMIEKGL